MRRSRLGPRLAALALLCAAGPVPAEPQNPEPKPLRVAVYHNFAPFSRRSEGIDVDLARKIAERLGRPADIVSYYPGESVEDDVRYALVRNLRADLMMHVPLDPRFVERIPLARMVAPYYREEVVVARDTARLPELTSLEAFRASRVGVAVSSLADDHLMAAFDGALRSNVVHFRDLNEAAAALRKGEVAAIMGESSELEAALGEDRRRYPIAPAPTPELAARAWDIGAAVRADDSTLAATVDSAVAQLQRDGVVEDLFRRRGLSYNPPQAR